MRRLLCVILCMLVAACGGGHPAIPDAQQQVPPPLSYCPLPDQKLEVGKFMARNYFWLHDLAAPDEGAATIAQYFDSLLYKPLDRYSFSETTAAFDQRVEQGVRVGYGYTLVWADAQQTLMRVRNVEPLGPAARAGLKRGDIVASVDGFSPAEIAAGKLAVVSTAGVERRFVLKDPAGAGIQVNMVSAEFPLTIVPATSILDVLRDDGTTAKVGYLAYQSFVAYADRAVGDAMQSFRDAGVDEVVLDLRYNGGGSVAVARDLASMLAGPRVRDKLFTYLRFNENNLVKNTAFLFEGQGSPLLPGPVLDNPKRLVVIASPATASASELVVNSLKPFMPVVLVGGRTYGKPYGSVVQNYCGTTYHAIQFTTLNADGKADYAQGFAPDCNIDDDLDHPVGDPREGRLAAALHYVKTGQCPAQATRSPPVMAMASKPVQAPPPVFGETDPVGMFVRD